MIKRFLPRKNSIYQLKLYYKLEVSWFSTLATRRSLCDHINLIAKYINSHNHSFEKQRNTK